VEAVEDPDEEIEGGDRSVSDVSGIENHDVGTV